MAYEVLARKWRPAQFDDVVGQSHVTRTLKHAIESNRVAHAYLFVGPRGIGKTTLSRIFAKALNCLASDTPTVTPCGACDLCREIAAGHSFDVLEIDGASNNGVDQVRDLRDQVQFAPARGRFRIIIIDEVHMLSASAFNALLKTLEEPPPHVKFIFATTEGDKIPPTIISRCQRFDLRRIHTALIVERLRAICEHEQVAITDDALLAVARGADGGMRDAQSALDQLISFKGDTLTEDDVLAVFGLVSRQSLEALAGHILAGGMADILRLVALFDSAGKDLRRLVAELLDHFRNLLVYQHAGADASGLDATPEQIQTLARQAEASDPARVLRVAELLAETEGRLRHALNVRTLLETALIRCARASTTVTLEDVIKRLNAIRSAEPPPAAAAAAAAPNPAARRQQVFDDPAVKRAMELFDGDVVGIEE
jgi:DNA polymerase-3 subunit gamma/tau